MPSFDELQSQLGTALSANRPGSATSHVMIVLPSFSLGESVLSHYAARIPALEHRYLLALFLLDRIQSCEMIVVCTVAPGSEVLDYYFSLVPEERRDSLRSRFSYICVPDNSPRAIADKLRHRPDILNSIRRRFVGRPAFIEPWNVTQSEVEVALKLGAPINGTDPTLWPLGFKSSGRRIFREAGVPLPVGEEDIRSVDDALAAIRTIRTLRPVAPGVVIKHDNSGAGDGNAVIRFGEGQDAADASIRARVEALPDWYMADLARGGIVEELIVGDHFSSPSAQVDITPDGSVRVLATHEQVLGGSDGQVYQGCRFPADPAYAAQLARFAEAVGEKLAARGVVGRFSVDFAAVRNADHTQVFALEINLRKGGTTHPYAALRNLVPGRYDPERGQWLVDTGGTRAYCSTDNLVNSEWTGREPLAVIDAVREAGLAFDHRTGTGVVLHMLSCLAIDGRFGVTAIGEAPADAARMFEAVTRILDRAHG